MADVSKTTTPLIGGTALFVCPHCGGLHMQGVDCRDARFQDWRPTAELRWRCDPDTSTKPPVLEQCWRDFEDGSTDWRAVPMVVVHD